jgi:hypothetical protein
MRCITRRLPRIDEHRMEGAQTSYAPLTVLVAERPRAVRLSYDRVASAIALYGNAEAPAVAETLDDAVPKLLHDAAG